MATIKAYTNIEQSRKLADILPIETADMRIGNYIGKSGKVDGTNVHYYPKGESFGAPEIIDAWSLAALLGVLPKGYSLGRRTNGKYYVCMTCVKHDVIEYDNPVDACYNMILKLKESNLL